MLRNFLYLDEQQLSQYISQVEDGLRRVSSRSKTIDKNRKVEIDAKIAKYGRGRGGSDAESNDYDDDGPARFQRLLSLVDGEGDEFGWFDLEADPSVRDRLQTGHIVELAAEVYESDITQLSAATGFLGMVPLARAIGGLSGKSTGLEQFDDGTLDMISQFGAAMNGVSIVIGELDDGSKFMAQIPAGFVSEGSAHVVGKVITTWGSDDWKMLPGVPIYSQLPRPQRRELERKGPDGASEMFWLKGPAMHLKLLAVYQ